MAKTVNDTNAEQLRGNDPTLISQPLADSFPLKGEAMGAVDIWKETRTVLLPPAQSNEEKMQFVCVNGRRFQVPKGVEVDVPLPVYEALREARRATAAAAAYERSVRAQT